MQSFGAPGSLGTEVNVVDLYLTNLFKLAPRAGDVRKVFRLNIAPMLPKSATLQFICNHVVIYWLLSVYYLHMCIVCELIVFCLLFVLLGTAVTLSLSLLYPVHPNITWFDVRFLWTNQMTTMMINDVNVDFFWKISKKIFVVISQKFSGDVLFLVNRLNFCSKSFT